MYVCVLVNAMQCVAKYAFYKKIEEIFRKCGYFGWGSLSLRAVWGVETVLQ